MNIAWRHAAPLALVVFVVSISLTFNLPKTVALLLWITPLAVAFGGIAALTVRQGGWRAPSGGFIVMMFGFLLVYLLMILGAVSTHTKLEESAFHNPTRIVYGLIMGAAIMSAMTFPWQDSLGENNEQKQRSARLDERSTEQDQRGVRQDRRGAGQDERAKNLASRTARIDARDEETTR